jgi:hypothetical protein
MRTPDGRRHAVRSRHDDLVARIDERPIRPGELLGPITGGVSSAVFQDEICRSGEDKQYLRHTVSIVINGTVIRANLQV